MRVRKLFRLAVLLWRKVASHAARFVCIWGLVLLMLPANVAAGSPCEAVNPTSSSPDAPTSNEVLVQVRIDKSGVLHDAKVVSGSPTLGAAAIKAVKRWKYQPASWATGSPTERQTFLAVTLVKGAAPKVQEVALGVPGCIHAPARVRVSQPVMQGYLIRRVNPVYPPEALAKHLEGIVVVKVIIDKEGSVYKAEGVSGPPELTPAAVEAVKQWKYQPYVLGGEPIEAETTAEIGFTLSLFPEIPADPVEHRY